MSKKKKIDNVVVEEPKVKKPRKTKKENSGKKKKRKKRKNKKTEITKIKKVVDKIDGRMIGTSIIREILKKEVNGTEYNEVFTIDGLTFLLSDEDLKNQISG